MNFKIPSAAFLNEARKEYSGSLNRRKIIEILQNSFDENSSNVWLTLEEKKFTFEDDGNGMDETKLIQGLLTYGGSIKEQGARGGFGAAKKLLILSHKNYTIETNDNVVVGETISYEIGKQTFRQGTKITIEFSDEWPEPLEDLEKEICFVVGHSTLPGAVFFNGNRIEQSKQSDTSIKSGVATIYERPEPGIIVRINGLYMFSNPSPCEKGYYFDLTGKSTEILNQNRESFRSGSAANQDYYKFLDTLSANVNQGVEVQFIQKKATKVYVDGWYHEGDKLPNLGPRLREKNQMIFTLAKIVGEVIGIQFGKKNFGFWYTENYFGCGGEGGVYINPEKFESEKWFYKCIETIIHESTHYLLKGDDDHNERFAKRMQGLFTIWNTWCLRERMTESQLVKLIRTRRAGLFNEFGAY